jgi:hypothetical protein
LVRCLIGTKVIINCPTFLLLNITQISEKQKENMKKIVLFILLSSTFGFSQNSAELKELNETLKFQKKSLIEKKINIEKLT